MKQSRKQNGHAYIRPAREKVAAALSVFQWMAWVDGRYIPKRTPLIVHCVPKVEHINYA